MTKRILALLLAVLMVGSIFTACGKKESGNNAGGEGSEASVEGKEITFDEGEDESPSLQM